jgi:hypothetical protein
VLTNVIFSGNQAEDGGGMFDAEGNPALTNCILWDNVATEEGSQVYGSSSAPVISYSDVQGSGGSGTGWDTGLGTDGGGNLDADPQFVTPITATLAPTTTGDYRLLPGSPAIDAGDNAAVPISVTIDLDGHPRIVGPTMDMGAYEAQLNLYLPLLLRKH